LKIKKNGLKLSDGIPIKKTISVWKPFWESNVRITFLQDAVLLVKLFV
jgi:hypothetical protein